ncbi:MAG TPA: hypothetical protein DHV36_21525 [Desulfobacteraceae bacterium]|nr:hypothetical protein [Desulfobacteraceae bacterium]
MRGISKWPAAHILEHSRPGKILFKEICGMGKNAIEIGATIKKDLVLQVDGNSYDWYEKRRRC